MNYNQFITLHSFLLILSFGKNESISGRWKIEKGNLSAVFAEKLKAGVHTCSF